MIKPLVHAGDSVRIPKGYVGVVTSSFFDSCGEEGRGQGWFAVVGNSIYRHEELEVVNVNRSDVFRPADKSNTNIKK